MVSINWNLWDDSGQWKDLIEAYKKDNPNIKIKYYKKNFLEYEEEMLNALAAGKGPDVFVVNNSWMPKYKENLEKYLAETEKPTARRDLVIKQIDDIYLGIFAEQALTAQSWWQVDDKRIESIFAEMIESVVLGRATAQEALNLAVSQVKRLME